MTKRESLSRILLVKERISDIRRTELASAEAAVAAARTCAQQATEERESAITTLTEAGETTGEDLARRAVLVALASRTVTQAQSVVAAREAARDESAEASHGAVRDVRALECVRGRLARREEERARAREQAESDEAAARIGGAR